MSLPSTGNPPVGQSSIRSFFTAKAPKYAPPPSSSSSSLSKGTNSGAPPPPPPPAATIAPPPAAATRPTPAAATRPTPSPTTTPTTVAAIPPLPSTLPRESSIRPVSASDINPLRRINALLLPVAYPDEFYKRLTEQSLQSPPLPASSSSSLASANGGRYSRVITWTHPGDKEETKVVGGVVCRLEAQRPGDPTAQTLYIRSLCLLSPYRSLGLAGAAVDNVVATAVADVGPGVVRTVTAHVWTENEEGLAWYEARGFRRLGQPIKGYYLKLRPDSAWLVEREVTTAATTTSISTTSTSADPLTPRSAIGPSVTAAAVNLPPIASAEAVRPPPRSGQSFQNKRADMEWNDLPAEMSSGLLAPPKKGPVSEPTSGASSRSSSTARKKRDRSYPAAAFGS